MQGDRIVVCSKHSLRPYYLPYGLRILSLDTDTANKELFLTHWLILYSKDKLKYEQNEFFKTKMIL